MKQSTQFVRLYSPSYREKTPWHVTFAKRLLLRVFLAVLAMVALYGVMEMACRLRGW